MGEAGLGEKGAGGGLVCIVGFALAAFQTAWMLAHMSFSCLCYMRNFLVAHPAALVRWTAVSYRHWWQQSAFPHHKEMKT